MILYESPVEICFGDDGLKVNGKKMNPEARTLGEMREVLLNKRLKPDNLPVYLMYRGVKEHGPIRFDITVIGFKMLGEEYSRTHGHYHPKIKDGITHPEIYQVLKGEGVIVLQKEDSSMSTEVRIIKAKERETIYIPSGYGHHTVNTSDSKPLILSNLVSTRFSSEYSPYKRSGGPAVFITKNGIVQNPKYIIKEIFEKTAEEHNREMGVYFRDLLKEFEENPREFKFLEPFSEEKWEEE